MQAEAMLSQLSTMNRNDLIQVRQMTDVLIGSSAAADLPIQDEREALLFDAVRKELSISSVNGKIPYTALRDSSYYRAWCKGVVVVNQFTDEYFQQYLKSKVQRIGIYRISIQALLSDFKRVHIPPSLGTVARNLHRVPQAFDNQFPGYLNCGLASLIVKAMTRK